MASIAFDNEKYLQMQSAHIRDRIAKFGGKLYLEFGGKLFDDFHASRVLPGFAPDSKIQMLKALSDKAEILIAINAGDIIKNKIRGDLGITYDQDVLRLIDAFRGFGLFVSTVVITCYTPQPSVEAFQKKLEALGLKVYRHYPISGYPSNIPLIVSDEGFGRNDYIETSHPLVVVTGPGPAAVRDAARVGELLELKGKKDARLVVNRVDKNMFSILKMTIDDVMDTAGLPLIGIVMEDSDVTLAAACGLPLLRFNKRSAAVKSYTKIANRIQGIPEPISFR